MKSAIGRVFVLVMCLGAAAHASALLVRAYDPVVHDRFTGYPDAPVANPTYIGSAFDFSGVGWDVSVPRRSVAMISPRSFVGARHFQIAQGGTVRFVTASGQVEDYTVGSKTVILNGNGDPTDLYVGTLTSPVSTGIATYALPTGISEMDLVGEGLWVYGREARTATSAVAGFTTYGKPDDEDAPIFSTRLVAFLYEYAQGDPNDAQLQGGDSSSPTFIEVDGSLALVGVHSLVGETQDETAQVNFDVFVPYYVDDLNAVLGGYGEWVTEVPEPAGWCGLVAGLGLWRRGW